MFAKLPLFDAWPEDTRGVMMGFWRALFAAMVLAPMVRRPRWRPLLVPLGLSFALMNVFYLTAMSQTTAANAIWLQNIAPWWVLLYSILLFREPIVRSDLLPLTFGAMGVGLIIAFEIQGQETFGVACGLISGVFYAAVVVLIRRLHQENSPWLVAMNHAVAMLALLPWVIYLSDWPSPQQLLVLAVFGSLQMALPYVLFTRGLRAISGQEAVAIAMVEPVLVPVWAYFTRGEVPAWWTLGGAALILTGLVLRYGVWEYFERNRPK